MRNLAHLVVTAVLAAFMACHPARPTVTPGAVYTSKVAACAASSKDLHESCECRKAVDSEFGVCEHPEWGLGRCDTDCSKVQ